MVVKTRYGKFPDSFAKYVRPTRLADFDVAAVKKRANDAVKQAKTPLQAINELHAVVEALPLGYDRDDLRASRVLARRRGQCNTKTTLFVALARAVGIPARVHAWRLARSAHRPRLPWLVRVGLPRGTLFTYPEVFYKDEWRLLSEVVKKRRKPDWDACPFDDAAARTHPLKKEWVLEDLGTFWHPDVFYREFGTNMSGWRRPLWLLVRPFLNAR